MFHQAGQAGIGGEKLVVNRLHGVLEGLLVGNGVDLYAGRLDLSMLAFSRSAHSLRWRSALLLPAALTIAC